MERKQVELCRFEWAFNLTIRFDSYNFIHPAACLYRNTEARKEHVSFELFTAIMCILFLRGKSSPPGCVRGIPLSRAFLAGVRRNVSTRWDIVISRFYRALNPAKEYEEQKEQPVYVCESLNSFERRTLIRILRRLLLEIKLPYSSYILPPILVCRHHRNMKAPFSTFPLTFFSTPASRPASSFLWKYKKRKYPKKNKKKESKRFIMFRIEA